MHIYIYVCFWKDPCHHRALGPRFLAGPQLAKADFLHQLVVPTQLNTSTSATPPEFWAHRALGPGTIFFVMKMHILGLKPTMLGTLCDPPAAPSSPGKAPASYQGSALKA